MFKHILIATDGSDLAQKAIAQGFALAEAVGAKVTIVTVTEPWGMNVPPEVAVVYPVQEYEQAAAANARKILDDAATAGMKIQVACQTVHVKDQYPAEGIVQTASANGCDLIVMASHGHRGLMRLVLGSQAHRVVTQSATSVLICR
ncbi:universal stress protein [Hyphomicrobium sp. ghe19]|uniref:universal stress protein n=1 Tax=Hyphomicrobium sp. ghe19 TaxID=2682968 RepID=UPI001366E24E|nr:TRAP-T-associated universal stress protein TeaD [Hyphomicrobium sp. ghe19]